MKVIERNITPDGYKIQMEDWSQDYSFCEYGTTVAAYMPAKDDISIVIRRHDMTRFAFEFSSHEEAKGAYHAMIRGDKTPADFVDFLWDKQYSVAL